MKTLGVSNDFFNTFEPEKALNQENTFNDIGYGYIQDYSQSNDIQSIQDLYEARI